MKESNDAMPVDHPQAVPGQLQRLDELATCLHGVTCELADRYACVQRDPMPLFDTAKTTIEPPVISEHAVRLFELAERFDAILVALSSMRDKCDL
jgi:hypothetical protein